MAFYQDNPNILHLAAIQIATGVNARKAVEVPAGLANAWHDAAVSGVLDASHVVTAGDLAIAFIEHRLNRLKADLS